jgi:protein-S-isoprenylcysteine O-methyltransferase Ste14
MPLSEREQRLLDQIERALQAEDPKLVSALRAGGGGGPTRHRFTEGVALLALGLVLLVLGVVTTSFSSANTFLWLSVVGFLLMLGGAVLAVSCVGAVGRSGFGDRMTRRLRRRGSRRAE